MTDAIQKSHDALMAKLARLRPTKARQFWKADDFEALHEYLVSLSAAIDEHILDCGREASCHHRQIDMQNFTGNVFAALDGFALFDIQQAAEDLQEESCPDYAEHSTLHNALQGV